MSTARRRRSSPLFARLCATALVAGTLALATGAPATATTRPLLLTSISVKGFPAILEDSGVGTLYVLSSEHAGVLHCVGTCLAAFRPLLVPKATTTVKVSSKTAVRGHLGFVRRSATTKQVTYNGYPIYTHPADHSTTGTKGESLFTNGGRWTLVHALAATNAATPFPAELQAANIPGFSGILEVASSRTLYVLSNEVGGALWCTTQTCLQNWPPLVVPSSTTAAQVSLGTGVDGAISFVARTSTTKQVMFNTYPVYMFGGDTGPNQSNGQGIPETSGTWYVVNASATTPSTTERKS